MRRGGLRHSLTPRRAGTHPAGVRPPDVVRLGPPSEQTGDALNADPRARRRHWLLIGALLLPAIVLPLSVPLYDRMDPELLGFPFFFWFQMAMIGVAVVLTALAMIVATRVDRLDRAAHGLSPEPPEAP